MQKRLISKGMIVVAILIGGFALNYFVKVDISWKLKSAEARADRLGPQTTISFEETKAVVDMNEETYIIYSDFDGDGDLDVAYTAEGPIRFIENKTVERQKN